ncbi:MAG: 1,4-alpha-glucan branching protein GlgB [Clostridia bacterium]|nr:1,4-alpha-glucan branching protein GlgB [Clostridia bacterium]
MRKTSLNSDYPRYLFHKGENFTAYEFMGAHRLSGGKTVFRVWAPSAHTVYLVCDAAGWDQGKQMNKLSAEGIWETVLTEEESPEGMCYKFRIVSDAGVRYKCDPYARASEKPPRSASVLYTKSAVRFTDRTWMEKRRAAAEDGSTFRSPMNIYEVHLASFMTKDGKSHFESDSYLNYRELAVKLADHVLDLGYTHVELMPITEYPYDGSWGYQVTGYYAPTARFGTPDDFKYFVNYLHSKGIGVILDWVPAHFPKDEHGLFEFDGKPLYEYADWRMEQPSWGTRCFDVARNEVRCFLVSSALYWIEEFHIDGLRIDAVAAMLYLDYDRGPGGWAPNKYGGKENLESIDFLKCLNGVIHYRHPDVCTIAEESTAFPKVTGRPEDGGLGFTYKWNMGWANDMFRYVSCDPIGREHNHSALTFPLVYAFSEKFVLPVSHDEVVHCKKSLIDKMFGNYEQKFSGMRLFLLLQMTYPGKKLLFMGSEFGQFREWDFMNQLEWFLLDYPSHRALMDYTRALNRFYLAHRELYEDDFSWNGFSWIDADSADKNLVAFIRRDITGNELCVVLNFSGGDHADYWMQVPEDYRRCEILFTAGGVTCNDRTENERTGETRREFGKNYLRLNIGPLSGAVIRCTDHYKGGKN